MQRTQERHVERSTMPRKAQARYIDERENLEHHKLRRPLEAYLEGGNPEELDFGDGGFIWRSA
jgi:hypothetical protein